MKHRLFTLVLFLLLGAVLNVAVASACALAVDLSKGGEFTFQVRDDLFYARLRQRPGAIRALVWRSNDPDIPADGWDYSMIQNWMAYLGDAFYLSAADEKARQARAQLQPVTQRGDDGNSPAFPTWIPRGHLRKRELSGYDFPTPIIYDARGWPFVAMRCEVVFPIGGAQGQEYITGGMRISPRAGALREWLSFRVLPIRPIWPGFAVNTLFYTAILLPLISGPFALRRLIRRKRGVCVACGYDIHHADHDVCPECGAAIRLQRAVAPRI
ncbi:MAG: hypothetical protein IH830_09110 [Planctomycetes bacterium]|nr:hypothetical protein [Planctomycetota bacterium]